MALRNLWSLRQISLVFSFANLESMASPSASPTSNPARWLQFLPHKMTISLNLTPDLCPYASSLVLFLSVS